MATITRELVILPRKDDSYGVYSLHNNCLSWSFISVFDGPVSLLLPSRLYLRALHFHHSDSFHCCKRSGPFPGGRGGLSKADGGGVYEQRGVRRVDYGFQKRTPAGGR
jgi:hypothetical protein